MINNENPLLSGENKSENIFKQYQDIKENHAQFLLQCQTGIFQHFLFKEIYDQIIQIPSFQLILNKLISSYLIFNKSQFIWTKFSINFSFH
jgi:hypothetical protein